MLCLLCFARLYHTVCLSESRLGHGLLLYIKSYMWLITMTTHSISEIILNSTKCKIRCANLHLFRTWPMLQKSLPCHAMPSNWRQPPSKTPALLLPLGTDRNDQTIAFSAFSEPGMRVCWNAAQVSKAWSCMSLCVLHCGPL